MNCFGALGSSCLLRESAEAFQFFDQLFFCRLLFEVDKYSCCMSIQYRNTYTLACDLWLFCQFDLAVFHYVPSTRRGSFSLFSSSPPMYGMMFHHFRPVFECLTCSGNCLICCNNNFLRSEFFPCCKCRCVALDGAVWFYCDESACCSETFFLILMTSKCSGLISGTTIGTSGVQRCALLLDTTGVSVFAYASSIFDLSFVISTALNTKSTEELLLLHLRSLRSVSYCFRHWCIHFPASAYCFFICLSCRTRACCYCYNFEPRMILKQ